MTGSGVAAESGEDRDQVVLEIDRPGTGFLCETGRAESRRDGKNKEWEPDRLYHRSRGFLAADCFLPGFFSAVFFFGVFFFGVSGLFFLDA